MEMGHHGGTVYGDGSSELYGEWRWRWTYLVAVVVGGRWYLWLDGGWRSMGGERTERFGKKEREGIVRTLHVTKLKIVRTTGRTLD